MALEVEGSTPSIHPIYRYIGDDFTKKTWIWLIIAIVAVIAIFICLMVAKMGGSKETPPFSGELTYSNITYDESSKVYTISGVALDTGERVSAQINSGTVIRSGFANNGKGGAVTIDSLYSDIQKANIDPTNSVYDTQTKTLHISAQ